ncbi:MAG: MFS transporter, partial [bacterium]|nr:MFS transporter [bacterium]
MIGVVLAMFLGALDQTIVATALPTIGRELGQFQVLSWVVTAYLLTATAVTPLYGKLSDIFGRRMMLLVAISLFLVGSVACALAPSLPALIAARAFQGLGGGALISLGQTIIGDVVAPRERGRYMAYFAAVFAASSVAGPTLGGIISDYLHWSFIFWINLPLGAAAYLMTSRVLKRLPRHDQRHRIDVLGAMLMLTATLALLLALAWGGNRYPWGSAPVIGMFLASLVLWALFGLRLAKAGEPFIPVSVLANPVVRNGTGALFFATGALIGLTVMMPLYFETVLGLKAAGSGFALVPLLGGAVTGATLSGRIMMRYAHYTRMPIAGLALATAITAVFAGVHESLSLTQVEIFAGLIGFGIGTVFPVATTSVQNAVPLRQLG